MQFRTLILVAALVGLPGLVRAADLTFTQDFIANFEFNVLDANGNPTSWQPYEAAGALTFTLSPLLNDPSQPTTVAFTGVSGTLNGVYPSSLLPFTISPDVQFIGGDLTNIARDGSGNVISADVSNLSSNWDLVADNGALTLFTTDGLPFNSVGPITSLPFADGTVLAGPDQFNVYLDEGGTNVLVALGRDRTLTAVPEPTSAVLAGMAALTIGAIVARRRQRLCQTR